MYIYYFNRLLFAVEVELIYCHCLQLLELARRALIKPARRVFYVCLMSVGQALAEPALSCKRGTIIGLWAQPGLLRAAEGPEKRSRWALLGKIFLNVAF